MTDNLSESQPLKNRLRSLTRPVRQGLNQIGIGRRRQPSNAFATHLPVLVGIARLFSIRKVLELGCGKYSTPTFLDRNIFPDLEILHSIETESGWADQIAASVKADPRATVTSVSKPMSAAVSGIRFEDYDLVFIDDSATYEERAETIRSVAQQSTQAKLTVIHDYECALYQEAAAAFANRFAFTALVPHTGLVWNKFSVEAGNLRALNRLIKKHARRIPPEDTSNWINLVNSALEIRPGKNLSTPAQK